MDFARKLMAATLKSAVTLLIVIGILSSPQSQAQSPAPRPEFEVASIKLGAGPGKPQFFGSRSPGTLIAQNINLRFIIRVAYGVRSFEVLGGPGWIDSDTFDITAKTKTADDGAKTPPPRIPEMFAMLQPLLEDRFKLKTHRETRELPVYLLTAAKGGLKMKPRDCPQFTDDNPPPPGPCNPMGTRGGTNGTNRTLEGTAATMEGLIMTIANTTRREIIDKTGLTGRFDFHLEWAPDEAMAASSDFNESTRPVPLNNASGPSLFTALQEQLGLKLESDKVPVQVLVIDHVERPEAN
jgi:uncharacterized protein (TIGR03435 family)